MVHVNDLKIRKPHTLHARRPKEDVRGKTTNPSSSTPHEEVTKEGSRYVHNTIAKLVTRILNEDHEVPGISVPLNSVMPDPPKDSGVNQDGSSLKETEDVPMAEAGCDVNAGNIGGGTGASSTDATIVEVDNISDVELIASVSPSIAKRLMTRRKGKAVMHSSPKKKTAVNSPIKKKDVVGSLVKKKAVPKSTSVGPTKSWSKVVPNKRKAIVLNETDSDVPSDVPDIPCRKKPSSSKLAASVPDVPIDNISFHFPSSVNRWKYVFQKRLALERELVKNALKCKEVMELIHHAGLMKTVSNFYKCYEILVKEFIVNLSEDCADAQSKLEVTDNQVCQVITAKQVKNWPLREKLSTGKLSVKYAMLHKIGAANWVPTNHKSTISIVLGRFIYVVGTKSSFDNGTRVSDVAMTSVGTSKEKAPTGKAAVIATLKETCQELESRKLTLEKLIHRLEMEEDTEHAEEDEPQVGQDAEADESDAEVESEESADGGSGGEDLGSESN
ncbi:uncharacterized protein LOC131596980 [Vicia villosa]|uniref:uncharacterized protein LOC131596980 n=1 Tax=Vicia villosa TaxID=3911 RepID=UPI00273CA35F|nr:uncharacterized protein LOC131596980 [Vicia villosa]